MSKTAETCFLSVELPVALRERARRISKSLRTSTNQIIREALREKIEFYEAKMIADSERERDEKDAKRLARRMQQSPLAPAAATAPVVESVSNTSEPDRLAPIYVEHARKILEVIGSPLERRVRVEEAKKAIERAAPLTRPSDAHIEVMLEREILKLRAAMKSEPSDQPSSAPSNGPSFLELRLSQLEREK